MKLAIVGLPQSGRSTIFAALTGARGEEGERKGSRADRKIGTIRVADDRLEYLTVVFKPKKTTYAQVEYLLPSETASPSGSESAMLNQARTCDALIHVIRNFRPAGGPEPTPEEDFRHLDDEMILSDLMVVEKRIERIESDMKKGVKPDEEEHALIGSCKSLLEENRPLRTDRELAAAPRLKGFTFLSAKPQLVILNNDDEDENLPELKAIPEGMPVMAVRGRLEMEISAIPPEEAEEFRKAYHLEGSTLDRVIRTSYNLLDLISFFTVVGDEVRAWTVPAGTPAVEAAGAVHTDMKRGFIRAEVISFQHLREYGSMQEAKKAGQLRLEGRDYIVQDGDIINFRFNI